MKTLVINTVKGQIEYSSRGRGKTILFVNGGHSNCKETIYQKGLNRDKYRFITPSRPGYGNTPLTKQNKSPKGTADLFIALLDKLNIQKAIVVGISAGGLTAIEIASNYQNRTERMVLLSALTKKWFVETDKVYRRGKWLFAPKIERYTWFFYRLLVKILPNTIVKAIFKELSKYKPIKYTNNELEELKKMTLIMRSGSGFVNDLDQNIDPTTLKRIVCPTLILHSENDNAVDLSHPQNANNKIRNSKLLTFNNRWGHLLWIGKEYEPILSKLKEFIE